MTRARSICSAAGCANLQPCAVHSGKRAFVRSTGSAGMGPGWAALRQAILVRDGETCQTCGARATQVDHVLPRHQGGTNDPSNLRALCARCHRSKSGREGREAQR